jgi:hypothetical protein
MKLWKLRLTWCAYCQRIVRWQRGAHLNTHPLPPGISILRTPREEWDRDEC